jgi:uncharacterized protein involved in type VI secretion and phage assembly
VNGAALHALGLDAGPSLEACGAAHLAEVVSVQDPQNLSRVQVRLLGFDGVADQDGPLWARVAVPFAGAGRGAFFLPDVGDEVLVVFAGGDARSPVVVGGLWNGAAMPPETLGGNRVDRWTLTGKAGTRIAIEELASGQPTVVITTPSGVEARLTDDGGGRIELSLPGGATQVTLESSGVVIETGSKVSIQASQLAIAAGQVQVDAAVSRFSGIVQCDVMQATTIIGATYTPGAGNVW